MCNCVIAIFLNAIPFVFRNVETGDIITVHTNTMEGAWHHAKLHFVKMAGTSVGNFEGHLCELIWRSHHRGNIYQSFYDEVKNMYPLDR